jgi:CobQ-like glutamine amidotransferase family enzyme
MKYSNLTPIIGFQNRDYVVHNEDNHLFEVITGYADNFKSTYEGYHENNFYGTHLIGPLLIRNPQFTDLIIKKIMEENKLNYHSNENNELYEAYSEYIANFYRKPNKKTE